MHDYFPPSTSTVSPSNPPVLPFPLKPGLGPSPRQSTPSTYIPSSRSEKAYGLEGFVVWDSDELDSHFEETPLSNASTRRYNRQGITAAATDISISVEPWPTVVLIPFVQFTSTVCWFKGLGSTSLIIVPCMVCVVTGSICSCFC